uniref:Putative tick transposon n=1 Tax=Ixodes ricinus TaxID=34613 RepID=A0A147BJD7_IXORI
MFHFFWANKQALVNRSVLHRPRLYGGWGIPDVLLVARTLSLRTTLQALDYPERPAGILALFWMGPLARHLVPPQGLNTYVKRETPGRHHAAIVAHAKHLRERLHLPDLTSESAARISELCAIDGVSLPSPLRQLWQHSCPSWLPGLLADFEWEVGSGILPTRDRLFRWHLVISPLCVYCATEESAAHVLEECFTARRFWTRVARTFQLRVPVRYTHERPGPSGPRARLRVLLTALGHHVLWRARCRARHYRARSVPIVALCRTLYTRLRVVLEEELAALGETPFEVTWGLADVVRIRLGRLEMVGARQVDFC